MTFNIRTNRLARQRQVRRWTVLASVMLSANAAVAACGGSDPLNPIELPAPDTSTFAGTWKGSVSGSYGYSVTALFLKADSTMTWESENPLYCRLTGTWTVSGARFMTTGRDCTNTLITAEAPLDKLRLTGPWSASSGRSGTFTVAKQ